MSVRVIDNEKKRILRGFGIVILVLGFICLFGGIWYGEFTNWTTSLAAMSYLIAIITGIILVLIGLVIIIAMTHSLEREA